MASSSSGFPVPPGQHPPFAVVTDTDHTAWILVATAVGLSCVFLFSGIRIFVRSTISPGFDLDDASLAASTVSLSKFRVPTGLLGALSHGPAFPHVLTRKLQILTVIQSSIVMAACSDGLGKSIELVPLEVQGKIQGVRDNWRWSCAPFLFD